MSEDKISEYVPNGNRESRREAEEWQNYLRKIIERGFFDDYLRALEERGMLPKIGLPEPDEKKPEY